MNQISGLGSTRSNVFDCAIIGGGISGLSLAILLADAGKSVVLFEKEKYPFHRVCGEFVSMENFLFLEHLGLPLHTIAPPMIDELLISTLSGNSMIRKLRPGGFGLSRYKMDFSLFQIALNKGVEVHDDTRVTDVVFKNDSFSLTTGGNVFQARLACGAFGKKALIDKKIRKGAPHHNFRGERNYMAVKYLFKSSLPREYLEFHGFEKGYCKIAAIEDGLVNFCYLTDMVNMHRNGNDIHKMEKEVLMKNKFIQNHFENSVLFSENPMIISKLVFGKKSSIENNVLMIGDAVGITAPFSSNGMSMALHSSFIASGLINDFLDGRISRKILHAEYAGLWDKNFYNYVRPGKYIHRFFGNAFLSNITLRLARTLPVLGDRLISLAFDKKPYFPNKWN